MQLFIDLSDKLEIKPNHVILRGITYYQATLASKRLDWAQFHILKQDGKLVDASFVVTKEESLRVWKLVGGDTPDPLLA